MLFGHHGHSEFQLTNFDSEIINEFLVEFSLKDFILKFFMEFVPVLFENFLQIDNLLRLEFKLVLIILLKRGNISMPQLTKFNFQCFRLLFCSLGDFSYFLSQFKINLFYSFDFLSLFSSQYFNFFQQSLNFCSLLPVDSN